MTTALQDYFESIGISREALSRTGINSVRLDELLTGSDPTIDEIRAISRELGISSRHLISRRQKLNLDRLKRRQNYSVDDFRAFTETADIADRAHELSRHLPERIDLKYTVALEEDARDFERAEQLAHFGRQVVLKVSELDPLLNLDRLLIKSTSVYMIVDQFRAVEGATLSANGRQFIFLAERPDPRMRFTLAHEFAHYLVDVLEDNQGWFDEDVNRPHPEERKAERFANAFAAALLMPAIAIGRALAVFRRRYNVKGDTISDVELVFLARMFGVNFQVAARRCEDLKLMPRGGGQSLYSNVIKKYKSPERLADSFGLPPRIVYDWSSWGHFLADRIRPAVMDADISLGRLSELVGLPIDALQEKLL
ncbi:ImmA/IrrE family metallo-endopeptidase [Methylobacterium sp. J-070]|uniref:ImmA/IrrE family metallo-endopeptidase n=1 Tax=Methylobacterium sp. J-070 TaxID=2836650 RepID=UPI001FBA8E6F|nr:ImmA/IrrE family metallo-endopeptidase [Methylobacterium sp. J-070]MCJ2054454.1 ImmA/IrrE family metallo-endopeptidase [Methylobacterium sp. J-070]